MTVDVRIIKHPDCFSARVEERYAGKLWTYSFSDDSLTAIRTGLYRKYADAIRLVILIVDPMDELVYLDSDESWALAILTYTV